MSDSGLRHSDRFGDAGFVMSSTFDLLDFRVAVHSDDPILVEVFEALFAETRRAGSADHALALGPTPVDGAPGCFASLDGSIIVRTPARTIAFTNLVFETNQQAIERSPDLVRLHAAAVGDGDHAVVMPGAMGAGKSTLAAELTRRGYDYITDEVVAIDAPSGTVRPYAKPLSLGTPPDTLPVHWTPPTAAGAYLGSSGLVPPGALGTSRHEPSAVKLVVLPRYQRDVETSLVRLGRSDALTATAAHAFHLDRDGTLAELARLIGDVPVYRLVSGDLRAAGDAVETLMASVPA